MDVMEMAPMRGSRITAAAREFHILGMVLALVICLVTGLTLGLQSLLSGGEQTWCGVLDGKTAASVRQQPVPWDMCSEKWINGSMLPVVLRHCRQWGRVQKLEVYQDTALKRTFGDVETAGMRTWLKRCLRRACELYAMETVRSDGCTKISIFNGNTLCVDANGGYVSLKLGGVSITGQRAVMETLDFLTSE